MVHSPRGEYALVYPFHPTNEEEIPERTLQLTRNGQPRTETLPAHSVVMAKVLYLGPQLERCHGAVVVATIAHEFAHLVLGHRLTELSPEEYNAQEEAAWAKVREWGFTREEKAHRISAGLRSARSGGRVAALTPTDKPATSKA